MCYSLLRIICDSFCLSMQLVINNNSRKLNLLFDIEFQALNTDRNNNNNEK